MQTVRQRALPVLHAVQAMTKPKKTRCPRPAAQCKTSSLPSFKAAADEWTELLHEYEGVIDGCEAAAAAGMTAKQKRDAKTLLAWLTRLYDNAYWHREDLVGVFGYKKVEALPQHQTFYVLQRRHAGARLKLASMIETQAKPKKRKPK